MKRVALAIVLLLGGIHAAAAQFNGCPSGPCGGLRGFGSSGAGFGPSGAAAFVPTGVVFDGDSITAGLGTNTEPFPTFFSTLTTVRNSNVGVSGDTFATRDTNYAAVVAPLYGVGLRDAVFILAGTNDIANAGATDLTLRTIAQSYCGKARATGYKVYIGTIIARSDAGWNGTKEGYRTAYNTWLKANFASFADGVIDFDAIPQSQNPADTTYFQTDLVHPTNALAQLFADAVRTKFSLAVSTFAFNASIPIGTATLASNNKSALTTSQPTTVLGNTQIVGKKFFTVKADTVGNFNGVGVGISAATGAPGFDGNKSIATYNSSGAFVNGSSTGSTFTFVSGDLVSVVVDEPNARIWFTKDGVAFFGLSGSLTKAQVEAGTGAFNLAPMKALGNLFPVVGSVTNSGHKARTEAFPVIPPSGYTQL